MNREDIKVTSIGITERFRFGGRVFDGLEDLLKYSTDKDCTKFTKPPYVVRKWESYPRFDSSDYAEESRYYQAYFLTMDIDKAEAICEEYGMNWRDFERKGTEEQYPVMESMFSMSKIQEHHLPYIYYHGDGREMEIVEDRNAKDKVEVLTKFEYEQIDAIPCAYGPQPGILHRIFTGIFG